MNKLKISIILCIISTLFVSTFSALAKTPRYNENGELCGYDYSIEDINMEKLRDLIANGSEGRAALVEIGIEVDGELIRVNNIENNFNIIVDTLGNSCVQLRPVAEAAGYTFMWDDASKTVSLSKDDINICLTVGNNTAIKNGKTFNLCSLIQIFDNSTYIAVKDVNNLLG